MVAYKAGIDISHLAVSGVTSYSTSNRCIGCASSSAILRGGSSCPNPVSLYGSNMFHISNRCSSIEIDNVHLSQRQFDRQSICEREI